MIMDLGDTSMIMEVSPSLSSHGGRQQRRRPPDSPTRGRKKIRKKNSAHNKSNVSTLVPRDWMLRDCRDSSDPPSSCLRLVPRSLHQLSQRRSKGLCTHENSFQKIKGNRSRMYVCHEGEFLRDWCVFSTNIRPEETTTTARQTCCSEHCAEETENSEEKERGREKE
ncbi:hypothetical protein Sjap_014393 [Stephania japonica]|uniref:Uncharacterized protein n=1 Tax=Stephania japonica TaxID=461633 RepID=A0AAP0IZT1_9MAGN